MDPIQKTASNSINGPRSAFQSHTFTEDVKITVKENAGSASISPSSRDIVLAGRDGLLIIDLDAPYSPPRRLTHRSHWEVADVQWSPFPQREHWIVSTSNQKALVWNLNHYSTHNPIEHTLHAHTRAITDINFSAHDPDLLATCAVDSFVHCWDLRHPQRPSMTFADWNAGATQVKWNRQDQNIIASSHDKFLKIWDKRKGAYPLKTIEAHSTKIYGVDWNRTRVSGIVTCSLDRTIKFWDYKQAADEPERVIRTDFPVWRARYTPFGWGVLAMPQRGDFNLHLYDRRHAENERDGYPKPVHSFEGHEGHVREFLWRFRGGLEDGVDGREFQLVSWSADKDLRLHRVDPKWLEGVGQFKNQKLREGLIISRVGASYRSFRDGKPPEDNLDALGRRLFRPMVGGLTKAFNSTPIASGLLPSSLRTYGRRSVKHTENPMKWIEGVKIGSRNTDRMSPMPHETDHHGDTPETLIEEMMYVKKRYKKVEFVEADVHGRSAKVTLQGPWGPEGKSALLRLNFEFPIAYPLQASPEVIFERTHSGVSDETIKKLQSEVSSIIEHYRIRRRGCLEAVITYLLGEKNIEESMVLKPHDGLEVPFGTPADDDSSDDEEDGGALADDLDTSGIVLPVQTNVPIKRSCAAIWGSDGQLICFFPPKSEPAPVFSLDALRSAEKANNFPRQFEVFGRLQEEPLASKDKNQDSDEDEDASSVASDSTSASSSSSEADDGISHLPARFNPPMAWRTAVLRNQKASSHSSGGPKKAEGPKSKTILSIRDFSDLLPAKKALAKEYRVFGDGPSVCDHNADVASRLGLNTLAAVWELCKQILYDEVPLEKIKGKSKDESVLVLAKRNAVRIKRKDSGLDMAFDEPEPVVRPHFTGRVKWGGHPFASTWLIPALFEHYEKEADIQMLAMLSCLFCEPAVQEGMQNALQTMEPEDLPVSVKAPAFSLNYFPSRNVATGAQDRQKTPRILTPAISSSQFVDYFSRHTTYGSLGSSNGRSGEHPPSEPVTPFSTGDSPPVALSRQPTLVSSLSTSPDPNSMRTTKRASSTLSNALATMTRQFTFANMASSPPVHVDRLKNAEADLSTSAPTSSVTWGLTTSFIDSSPNSPMQRRKSNARTSSFVTHDSTYVSSEEEYLEPSMSDEDEDTASLLQIRDTTSPKVKVTLKNQGMFDDEGCAIVPLLDPPYSNRWATYRAMYANLLGRWCLHIAQAEVLKFNGLIPYLPQIPTTESFLGHHSVSFETSRPSAHFLLKPQWNLSSSIPLSPRSASGTSSPSAKPLNPTAQPFIPTPTPGILRTSTHLSQSSMSEVQGIFAMPRSSTPPLGSEKFELGLHRRDSTNTQPSLLQRATSHRAKHVGGAKRPEAKSAAERTCVVCWEYVHGLHVVCKEGNHRAHMDCVSGKDIGGILGEAGVFEAGLGCPCEDA